MAENQQGDQIPNGPRKSGSPVLFKSSGSKVGRPWPANLVGSSRPHQPPPVRSTMGSKPNSKQQRMHLHPICPQSAMGEILWLKTYSNRTMTDPRNQRMHRPS
ncbi:hypothetical protein ACLOJK_005006 [Asimina triloba]